MGAPPSACSTATGPTPSGSSGMVTSRDLASWRAWPSPSRPAATGLPGARPSAKDVRAALDCAGGRSAKGALSCSAGVAGRTAVIPPASDSAAWRWSDPAGAGGAADDASAAAGRAWSGPTSGPTSGPLASTSGNSALPSGRDGRTSPAGEGWTAAPGLSSTGAAGATPSASPCTAARGRSRGGAGCGPGCAPPSRPGPGCGAVLAVLWTMGSAGGSGAGPGGVVSRSCRHTGRSGTAGGPPSSGTGGCPRPTAGPGIESAPPRRRSSAGARSAGSRRSSTDAREGPAAGGLPASDATGAPGASAGGSAPGIRAGATSNGGAAARATTGLRASTGDDGGGGEGRRLPAPGCPCPGPAGPSAAAGGARGSSSRAPSSGRARASPAAGGSPACRWRRGASASSGSPARGSVAGGSGGWGERTPSTSGPTAPAGAASAAGAGACSSGRRRMPGAVARNVGSSPDTFPLPVAGDGTGRGTAMPLSSWKCASWACRCTVGSGEVVVGLCGVPASGPAWSRGASGATRWR